MSCAELGEHELVEVEAEHSLRVGRLLFRGLLRAMQCRRCSLKQLDGDELERFEHAVARELAASPEVEAEAFRFMREAIGATQGQLAAEARSNVSTVHALESGHAPPTEELLAAAARLVMRCAGRTDAPRLLVRQLARCDPPSTRGPMRKCS